MNIYPIIYVRGYAGTQGAVEETVDDPFHGFNVGSTHVRVGPKGKAQFFGFESPLIRMLTDSRLQYTDAYHYGKQGLPPGLNKEQKKRTIWIYRYYDPTSETFSKKSNVRLEIEQAAEGLAKLIERIKKETKAEYVYLIAHSMGGLICRSLIQKYYPEEGDSAKNHVAKLFTFGTPHGGIHFDVIGGAALEWIRDTIGWNNGDDFGPDRMYEYLTANPKKKKPKKFDPRELQGDFPPENIFCLVGTNAHDYEVAHGMSRRAVGPLSDGLVQIDKAYVKGCNRAYVHRSHSGRYGIVSSEEGYQNLLRFLFGTVKVEMCLCDIRIDKNVIKTMKKPTFFVNVSVAIRGLPVLMHEQTVRNLCPIEFAPKGPGPIHLYTSFLVPEKSGAGENTSRFSVTLALHAVDSREGFLWFDDHLEEVPLWSDTLVVDVKKDPPPKKGFDGWYSWRSEKLEPEKSDTMMEEDHPTIIKGGVRVKVPLPSAGLKIAGPKTHLRFDTSYRD